jgi:hypothetical protein
MIILTKNTMGLFWLKIRMLGSNLEGLMANTKG